MKSIDEKLGTDYYEMWIGIRGLAQTVQILLIMDWNNSYETELLTLYKKYETILKIHTLFSSELENLKIQISKDL